MTRERDDLMATLHNFERLEATADPEDRAEYGRIIEELRARLQPSPSSQPRLSEEQIVALVYVGQEAARRVAEKHGSALWRYDDYSPLNQEIVRATVEAIAYAIMDNPAQFAPRTIPVGEGE